MSGNEERLLEAFVEGLDRSRGLAAERDAAAFVAKLDGIIGESIVADKRSRGVYSGKTVPRWVSRLNGADAVWKSSGFGVGNGQLKSWSRYAIGVGALTSAIMIAVISIKYIPSKTTESKTYSTAPGQRANITLSNGLQAYLAPASSITISGAEIKLSGHAIFRAKHNKSNPLTVIANGVRTRVLGTVFSVRAYEREGCTRVAVREGRVSVQPATVTSQAVVILSANQSASVEPDGRVSMTNSAAVDDFAAAQGKLVLREAPLGAALLELSRWYGLDFRTTDAELLTHQITTTLPETLTNDSLQEIAAALGARVNRNGNTVTFEPR